MPEGKITSVEYHIEPEHEELLKTAMAQLVEYEASLLERLKERVKFAPSIDPDPVALKTARWAFLNDPFRLAMIQRLSNMRAMFEQPRIVMSTESI